MALDSRFSYKIRAKSGRPFLEDVPVALVGSNYFQSRGLDLIVTSAAQTRGFLPAEQCLRKQTLLEVQHSVNV